ncbi:futalosine hydrolase [Ginsengibacter hankyongi]|uniref:Futalosine hydrolase n=1 Tax=Ginsengibacter hankyongi TaxID=2607284 RepID=A0A5J5IJU3_9BACT|nr:futalosine hydrolase [Ginsengibacter hankyongi]KAA9040673.1 futalosine hydrolase [Ginsengibacter hankyongi]
MNVLVIAATEFEIEPFLRLNNTADVLIAGVGVPSTIYNLTKKLLHSNYDLVIQAGIAGSFTSTLQNGSVTFIEKDTFADIGVDEKGNFKTLFDMGFIKENEFPFTSGWLENQHAFLSKTSLALATGITVNKITDDINEIRSLSEKFNAGIESMEGAALHYVCLQQKINFVQLRSISNSVGERDKQKWAMKEAITNLNIELKKLIDHFI